MMKRGWSFEFKIVRVTAGFCSKLPLAMAAIALSACSGSAEPPAVAAPLLSTAEFQLLNRLTWGATVADAKALRTLGLDAWLDDQLRAETDFRMPDDVRPLFESLADEPKAIEAEVVELIRMRAAAQAVRNESLEVDKQNRFEWGKRVGQFSNKSLSRSILRDIYSKDQIREQMTWFWFNHFNIYFQASMFAIMSNDYEENVIRKNSLGKFCTLLKATLQHPAMMLYLDNAKNKAGLINENYARELLELHTMGVGSEYTQKDVEQLARVLTGAGFDFDLSKPTPVGGVRHGFFIYDPALHEKGSKTLLGHRIAATGYGEITESVNLLCRHPTTARRISTRIAQYFVADEPPKSLIDAMTEKFTATDGDITAVLRTMIKSPEFAASLGNLYKDPNHYVISGVRLAFEDRAISNPIIVGQLLNDLGQPRYRKKTPDGYPLGSAEWTGSGQLSARFVVAGKIGAGLPAAFLKGDGPAQRVIPDIRLSIGAGGFYPVLAPSTRDVLAGNEKPADWTTLFLSSPEFMRR